MNLYSDAHAKSRIEMFLISSQNGEHEIPVSMLVLLKLGPLYVLGILVERAMVAGKMPPINYVRIAKCMARCAKPEHMIMNKLKIRIVSF